MSPESSYTSIYQRQGNVHLDVYLPPSDGDDTRPGLIYFHGGGLCSGNRKSWFPLWLYRKAMESGYIFICPDYSLLTPSTAYDIVRDIKKLAEFLREEINDLLPARLKLDITRLAVSGSSAGGYCAYLAAIHSNLDLKCVLSMYGQGGDMLTAQYLAVKTKPFFRNREILDPDAFKQFLHPTSDLSDPVSDSPLAYHPSDSATPGYPANPRMQLPRLYMQLGNYLDYLTGEHGLSDRLRTRLKSLDLPMASELEKHRPVFPQFNISTIFPPTVLVHGASDTAVLLRESQNIHNLLQQSGCVTKLVEVPGAEHSFDYEPDSATLHGDLLDDAFQFLFNTLART